MSSSARRWRRRALTWETWNRKLHFYLGLYFLFFIWLFAVTGWLLNHGRWAMSLGANDRGETRYERTLEPLAGDSDTARAHDVMRQLDLRGEINWPSPQRPGVLAFNVNRPNDATLVRVDLAQSRAAIQHFDNSGLATIRIFHTFSGSQYTDAARREWLLTTVWVMAMDALGMGLVVMVLGSYYMWWRLRQKRTLGAIVLIAGAVSCAAFAAGAI